MTKLIFVVVVLCCIALCSFSYYVLKDQLVKHVLIEQMQFICIEKTGSTDYKVLNNRLYCKLDGKYVFVEEV